MLSSNVLVLNRSFVPIHVTNLRHALCLMYRDIAKAVDSQFTLFDFESWSALSVAVNDEKVGLVDRPMRIPRVILLHFYDKIPRRILRFSRMNVYLRDRTTCQYCGKSFAKSDLNLDHVVPVSQGGKTIWENVVCSCIPCNIKKGGRTPEHARMHLLKKPMRPDWTLFFKLKTKNVLYEEWKPYLNMVDFSYWNVELKD